MWPFDIPARRRIEQACIKHCYEVDPRGTFSSCQWHGEILDVFFNWTQFQDGATVMHSLVRTFKCDIANETFHLIQRPREG